MLNKMYTELRQTKMMLEVPRLRQEVNKKDLKGIDFKNFTKVVGSIYKGVKKDLLDEAGILVDSSDSERGTRLHTHVHSKRGSPKGSQSPAGSLKGSKRKTSVDSKSTKLHTN